jgi:selenocysteine lyase/cysteine desulfurase
MTMTELTLPTYADVEAAAARLAGHAHRTPVLRSHTADAALQATLYFKCENLQRMGAFKFRGAFNALSRFSADQRRAGVLAFSSGNHAQAIALSARELGMPAVIVMPADAPAAKLQATRGYGAEVITLSFPFGEVIDLGTLRDTLNNDPEIKAVLVTHNETSTGVTNDLQAVAELVKGEFDKLLIVDGISSVASLPLSTDAWGCDVVATASQKGWMVPPGLAFISMSERAWEAHAEATMPRFYFDAAMYKRYYEIGQPPYTPSVSTMFALDLALDKLLSEGMGSVFERHASIGQFTRD